MSISASLPTSFFLRTARWASGMRSSWLKYSRTARFQHWLETRARRWPPNSQSLGEPVSSRFRLDGAKFCMVWISMNMAILLDSFLGFLLILFERAGPEITTPAALDVALAGVP